MDEAPNAVPAPAPVPAAAPAGPPRKSRAWFVVLAWITLVAFGIFVAGITAVTAAIPQIKRARESGR